MAAVDTFNAFLGSLSPAEADKIKDFIQDERQQIFAARSEDARVRLAHEFINEVHDRLKKK